MTELAYLLESSAWENISGTHYYQKKARDVMEWMSPKVSEEVSVQVPLKKEYGQ